MAFLSALPRHGAAMALARASNSPTMASTRALFRSAARLPRAASATTTFHRSAFFGARSLSLAEPSEQELDRLVHDTHAPIRFSPWMPSLEEEKSYLIKVLGTKNEELARLTAKVAALDEELTVFRAARDAKLQRERDEWAARASGGFQE